MKKIPFIPILTGLYVCAVALYMVFNQPTDAWKNYYWIVNKSAMLMALMFNYKKQKSKSDWLFVNFLTIQTICIIIYFSFGLPLFYKWMQQNDAVIYSFFIGGFIALILLWVNQLGIYKGFTKTMIERFKFGFKSLS